ncbi:hypothetical protein PsorP6_010828 [Peronosclerospora sorghi]|uniref:Uncharacterized protein n=1 Tax=Peronosclerospora sorghi TaxID=230839 RepID=A0ACC0VYI9_9STRA|nr:hypothetical protein PsorP6_010828 [Peronosclerospora sorghi]
MAIGRLLLLHLQVVLREVLIVAQLELPALLILQKSLSMNILRGSDTQHEMKPRDVFFIS